MSLEDDFIRIVGKDAFDKLCAVYGGMRFYVGPGLERRFSVVVGDDLARRITREFSQEVIAFPKESSFSRERARTELIDRAKQLHSAGATRQEIAVSLDITDRRVRQLLNQSE